MPVGPLLRPNGDTTVYGYYIMRTELGIERSFWDDAGREMWAISSSRSDPLISVTEASIHHGDRSETPLK